MEVKADVAETTKEFVNGLMNDKLMDHRDDGRKHDRSRQPNGNQRNLRSGRPERMPERHHPMRV